MIVLLGAVIVASLVGSAHCVGMCGPMVLIAIGMKSSTSPMADRSYRALGYHLGRAATYLIMGATVGWLGSMLDRASAFWGWIGAATTLAGGLMIAVGIWQLWNRRKKVAVLTEHDFLTRWLLSRIGSIRKSSDRLPGPARAFVWGFATTWLPCGWLYTFALVAAGTGDVASAMAIMMAFWVGTLPALSGLAFFWSRVTPRFQTWVPSIASVLLILFGSHVVLARSGSSMGDWLQTQQNKLVSSSQLPLETSRATKLLHQAVEEPPPCCRP